MRTIVPSVADDSGCVGVAAAGGSYQQAETEYRSAVRIDPVRGLQHLALAAIQNPQVGQTGAIATCVEMSE